MTIEERVKEKMEWLTNECTPFTLEKPYTLIKTTLTDIATEQKEIDINQACEWLLSQNLISRCIVDDVAFVKRFRKAMED